MILAVVVGDIGVNLIAGVGWVEPPYLTIFAVVDGIHLAGLVVVQILKDIVRDITVQRLNVAVKYPEA